jgi:hypothetical protein
MTPCARDDRWLYGAAFLAGLGVTHHPLTVFSAPAYLSLCSRCAPVSGGARAHYSGWVLAVLLGLSLFLYYPLRSPMQPLFRPP